MSIFKPAFERAKTHGLKSTIHFAEVSTVTTEELWTLLSFEPDRLGHVIHVPDAVRAEILKRKLGLELCLSCNVHAKMITGTFGDHHFGYWKGKACPIALSVISPSFVCGLSKEKKYIPKKKHTDFYLLAD